MPPLRGSSAVRGRSRDIVIQVEDKLKLNKPLPREIVEATRSSLRVLKIRNPIGCFGKYDNETKRACALLEYDVRDYNSNNKIIEIPMEKLAKAAFMKLKDFRDFHEKIGNFRDNLRISVTKPSKSRGNVLQKDGSGSNIALNPSSTKSGTVFRKSSIPSLAIQLGAFVPDSSGAAMQAQKLFTDVVSLLKSSSKKDGIYGLRDVQKNQASYEAACFYLVGTSEKEKSASIRRRRRGSKEVDDRDDSQQLDLKTFVDITKVSPQFQTILDYVNQLKHEIESKESSDLRASQKSRRSLDSSMPSRTAKPKASRKRSMKEAFDFTHAIGGSDSNTNQNDISGDPKIEDDEEGDIDRSSFFLRDHSHDKEEHNDAGARRKQKSARPNTTFMEWKSKILREACEDARQRLSAEDNANGKDCDETQKLFESEKILDFVVRGILSRNGLWG